MLARTWILAFTFLPAAQAMEGSAPSPFDRVVELALTAEDPPLEGHGSCEWVDYVAEFSGTLHVWTKVEGALDTFLRVQDDAGKLLAEDDDSGGKPTPYVKLEVEPGTELAIAVASSKGSRSRGRGASRSSSTFFLRRDAAAW